MNKFFALILVLLSLSLSGCGYNTLQSRDEQVSASWSNVLNLYQKRADLVPNLVEVVKGYATHESDTFKAVTEARASVGSIKATPELLQDENAFKNFSRKQSELTNALQRLLLVSERYPDLKANANFMALQNDIKQVESQIAHARSKYIKDVKDYNVTVRSFPVNLTAMVFGMKTKPNFAVENEKELKVVPKVSFK